MASGTSVTAPMMRIGLVHYAALALFAALAAGCTPVLGDPCVLSTDCSLRGDRTCDTSQPGGYCTIRDCRGNGCPDDGACVLFEATVPGCAFDSRAPSRVGRSYCMAACADDTDCRGGYVCVDAKAAPWLGVILDDDTSKRVCIVPATPSTATRLTASAPVCSAFSGDAGVGVSVAPDAGADSGRDAATLIVDAGNTDAADAGTDAALPSDAASGG